MWDEAKARDCLSMLSEADRALTRLGETVLSAHLSLVIERLAAKLPQARSGGPIP